MEINQLGKEFYTHARAEAVGKALSEGDVTRFYGLAGSSAAILLSSLPRKKNVPMLVVGDSADDAGYLYHDLSRLLGEEKVVLFPSGYKRDIRYGQVDAPSQILRTEALGRVNAGNGLHAVVTYPEALAEKVAAAAEVEEGTLRLATGGTHDLRDIEKWLRDNGFREVDYVYEPGTYAIRGSILDIFGYSYELPYRVDFFGDEIDSIRSFNVETQLSEEKIHTRFSAACLRRQFLRLQTAPHPPPSAPHSR